MNQPATRTATYLVCALLWVTSSGCGPQRARAVNVELAKETLIKTLEHWKGGGAIVDMQKLSPQIIVQDQSWAEGRILQEFVLRGEGRPEDANWICEVELTLASTEGGEAKKRTVTYVVGTNPVLTVFRAIL